ncbi:MAG: hypoxanthine phosphoribosyltransferase [Deltaproteobacteria bacterium CG_4_8_14_3_um_filter_51_11]|nr:hypoxanthine phosphoribosyltransferase [bacterium]OIP43412.1 MAG: hypoxanthine phosphoribosyltransferase [Desulfobacteraceae bacterium CG2_30_51_40]PIP46520.1 MAG: hypoxanthine phosphoribosyltransferase [Deltaproteobacteria bacterium CG23_combo_of_CG06-09_8_20_14_all_51_20]PIX18192.1 MAG: hypoxanthine phosphoribosyltransferase [Deltaproteobacteria bacterium CG_4_8_14_3_um_filter_51_11]PIY26455.1 MAG: hypoxanthine phosphoribosyltransferase [Deltaproteobacteria bacterium CG_4_10_14_3_um_filter
MEERMEKELLISKEMIQKRVKELASEIARDHQGKDTVLVGILKGAVFFFCDLARELDIQVGIDFLRAASYGPSSSSSGTITLTKDVETPLEGKSVVLVEDIIDTGLTMSRILEELKRKKPSEVKVCVLLDKPERREIEVQVDYCGFRVEGGFVVGYGLDYDEQYRNLSEIFVLKGI